MEAALRLLLLLLAWHSLADYPLQGDFLARAKNRQAPIAGVPWWQALAAHAAIHAGGVLVLTGSAACCLAEFVVHFVVDDLKCAGRLSFSMDQAIHVAAKVAFVAAVWSSAVG